MAFKRLNTDRSRYLSILFQTRTHNNGSSSKVCANTRTHTLLYTRTMNVPKSDSRLVLISATRDRDQWLVYSSSLPYRSRATRQQQRQLCDYRSCLGGVNTRSRSRALSSSIHHFLALYIYTRARSFRVRAYMLHENLCQRVELGKIEWAPPPPPDYIRKRRSAPGKSNACCMHILWALCTCERLSLSRARIMDFSGYSRGAQVQRSTTHESSAQKWGSVSSRVVVESTRNKVPILYTRVTPCATQAACARPAVSSYRGRKRTRVHTLRILQKYARAAQQQQQNANADELEKKNARGTKGNSSSARRLRRARESINQNIEQSIMMVYGGSVTKCELFLQCLYNIGTRFKFSLGDDFLKKIISLLFKTNSEKTISIFTPSGALYQYVTLDDRIYVCLSNTKFSIQKKKHVDSMYPAVTARRIDFQRIRSKYIISAFTRCTVSISIARVDLAYNVHRIHTDLLAVYKSPQSRKISLGYTIVVQSMTVYRAFNDH
ncbi:unnamed protein product [Trichogramma brassicae]|uniref:Uncharacterized protein n=1 Tax=Trichogramma brassicae TaxID=86971 RepID=A0A6H5IWY8_9HYME|nr:unnamed protein product [Trichogramma brassicae]